VADVLGASVRRHREAVGISAKTLSERIAALGGSLSRQAISMIETGHRGVTLDELMYLARAMKISPLRLLLPDPAVMVQVGGVPMSMQDAAHWFTAICGVCEGYPPTGFACLACGSGR
jgi:transcriptional regulator with XRE-family HTH domain